VDITFNEWQAAHIRQINEVQVLAKSGVNVLNWQEARQAAAGHK